MLHKHHVASSKILCSKIYIKERWDGEDETYKKLQDYFPLLFWR